MFRSGSYLPEERKGDMESIDCRNVNNVCVLDPVCVFLHVVPAYLHRMCMIIQLTCHSWQCRQVQATRPPGRSVKWDAPFRTTTLESPSEPHPYLSSPDLGFGHPTLLSTPLKRLKHNLKPRSIPLKPRPSARDTTSPSGPVQIATPPPTPIPFSSFSQPPTTPGLSLTSTCSSTPIRGTRLLTPITPTHIRYDDTGLPLNHGHECLSTSLETVKIFAPWSNYGSLEDQEALLREMPPTPRSIIKVPWDISYAPQQVDVAVIDLSRPKAKTLHHVSSDGGPIAALERYVFAFESERDLGGMSLFLNCPKKRVPFHSISKIRKERRIAMEWNRILRCSGMSNSLWHHLMTRYWEWTRGNHGCTCCSYHEPRFCR